MQNILLIIFLSFTTSIAHAGAPEKATLKQFLSSENADQRLQAFNIITLNKNKFRSQILDELQLYATKPDQTPDGLLYLAANILGSNILGSKTS